MTDNTNLSVRITGGLRDHVEREVTAGAFENASDYVNDLIRRDKSKADEAAFQALKTELQLAFAAQESEFVELSAADIVARNRA